MSGALVKMVGRLGSDRLLGWLGPFLRDVSVYLPFYMASSKSLLHVVSQAGLDFLHDSSRLFKSATGEIVQYS